MKYKIEYLCEHGWSSEYIGDNNSFESFNDAFDAMIAWEDLYPESVSQLRITEID